MLVAHPLSRPPCCRVDDDRASHGFECRSPFVAKRLATREKLFLKEEEKKSISFNIEKVRSLLATVVARCNAVRTFLAWSYASLILGCDCCADAHFACSWETNDGSPRYTDFLDPRLRSLANAVTRAMFSRSAP